ncbi:MAG: hypothetical protein SGJ15_03315 [Bacteroidota bacterium]|nr:hypothetical protein [Bacteroidota bacterium]
MKALISTLAIAALLISCKKKEEPAPDPIPTLEIVSISPSTVKEFQDSVIIKLKYKDANGDLGDQSPDLHSLYVKDSRLPNPDTYHVKPLAPISSDNIPIEGELTIKLNALFLLGTGTSEATTLNIKIKDRAGNWSKEVTSAQLTITK